MLSQLRPLLEKSAVVSDAQRRGLMYLSIMIALMSSGLMSMMAGSKLMRGLQLDLNPALLTLGSFSIPSLAASLFLRRGLGYRLLKIEIVTRTGLPASRWRTFLRCLLAWLPFWLMLLLGHITDSIWPVWMFVLCVVGGIAYRVIDPGRTIRDRLAGTWLVPG